MVPLKIQAVQTALQGDWKAAIVLNEMLLEENPEDIDALNRLAFAKASIGESKEAKNIYQKVLTLDANNPIAIKNLQRMSGSSNATTQYQHIVKNVFIEEPGKTKVVELINTADKKVVTPLRNGENLMLHVKRMKIFVLDNQKQYIGMLPDDIGNRLINFIEGGNQYEAYVKTIHTNRVIILVKEVKRANKFKNQPSFISLEKTKLSIDNKSNSKNNKIRHQSDDSGSDMDYEESES